jgi:hypothetical protein
MIKKQIMKDYVIDITDNIVSHCVSTVNKDDINITTIVPIIKVFINNYLTINTKKQNKKIIDINGGLYYCLKMYDGNIQLQQLINNYDEEMFYIELLGDVIFKCDFHHYNIKNIIENIILSYDDTNESEEENKDNSDTSDDDIDSDISDEKTEEQV